jgi:hypothetical protein
MADSNRPNVAAIFIALPAGNFFLFMLIQTPIHGFTQDYGTSLVDVS